jgi:hypothetical protein
VGLTPTTTLSHEDAHVKMEPTTSAELEYMDIHNRSQLFNLFAWLQAYS